MSDKKTNSDNPELTPGSQDSAGNSEEYKPSVPPAWSWYKKLGFRIIFIFFLAMSIPFSSSWYKNLFTLDWFHPHYRDIYDIARFQPSFRAFLGGRGNYEDGDAPAGNEAAPGGGRNARNHNSGGGANDIRTGGKYGDSAGTGSEKRFSAGQERGGSHRRGHSGDFNQADGRGGRSAGATGEGRREGFGRHHGDSAQTGNGGGGRLTGRDHEGGFRRRHRGDSTQAATGEGRPRGFRVDSAQAAGRRFAAEGRGGFRRHRRTDSVQTRNAGGAGLAGRHHRDSAGSGNSNNRLAAENNADKEGPGRYRRRDSGNVTDSSGHDSTKTAAFGSNTGRRNGNGLPAKRNFLADYTDWGIAFLIGVVGGLIWTLLDRKSKEYYILYYWLRVIVRFRAGIGIIGFGFTKLFPTQMPYPSLGLLNSNFGDFTAQKIYWMSVGIVPWYQVFGGIVEILAGTLLFFRRTTTFGAILLMGALGDITYVNYAYDGGVHVYAFYFVFLSLFLIADDVPKLYNLLIRERYTVPVHFYPDFSKAGLKYTRIGLKALTFFIFFGVLTYTEIANFKYDPYKQPSTAGVKNLRGNYNVTEFRINGQEIPYNPLDTVRWQQATFENWTTLSFKVNRPVVIDPSNGGGSPMKDIQRTFEITGVAGGQRAFHYYADTIDKVLYLQDKNAVASRGAGGRGGRGPGAANSFVKKKPEDNWISKTAWEHIGDEKTMIDKRAWSTRRDREFARKGPEPKRNRMILKYSTADGSRVILSGIDEHKDSIYVVLDRYNKKYVLSPGNLSAGKY